MNSTFDLSIIIPTYNEEKRIGNSLSTILSYCDSKALNYEVIIVDDGSRDATLSVVKKIVEDRDNIQILPNEENRGKGFAIRCGISAARGKYVLFTDADLSTPIQYVEVLCDWLDKGNDICIGSRALPDSNVSIHQPFYREWMGKIYNRIIRITLGLPFRDTQCGFKCFRADVMIHLAPVLCIDRFGFDVELLYVANKWGHTIKEVGVEWSNSPETTVSLIADPIKMMNTIPQIYLNVFRGLYNRP